MRVQNVSGFKIRQTIDPDFNIIGIGGIEPYRQNGRWYIPKGELWFDRQFIKEKKFLLEVEAVPTIRDLTQRFIDLIRKKTNERFIRKGKPPKFIQKTVKRSGQTIRYIDGSIVRRWLDPDFTFGGHDCVYSYIPKGEIWIDARMDPRDVKHVLIHEQTEQTLMRKNKKTYEVAHEYATAAERESRRRSGAIYPGDPHFSRKWTLTILRKYFKGTTKNLP